MVREKNDIRTMNSDETFVVNEQTYEVTKKSSMKVGRCGH